METKGISGSILRCEPIVWNGLTLYPIKVSQYGAFSQARRGIEQSQQRLPGKYASMLYLEALYALEVDFKAEGIPSPGYFKSAVAFLMLALEIEPARKNGEYPVKILVSPENGRELKALEIRQEETLIRLTPKDFNLLRPLLAEQNGLRLPDEANNAELEDAEQDIAAGEAADLEYDFEALLYAVARQWGREPEELWDWPIRKFLRAQDAAERSILHTLYFLAEASGNVKFPKGNPYPSWKFNRKAGLSAALIPLDQFQKSMGAAVNMK